MNINELSAKNLRDAVDMYKTAVARYKDYLPNGDITDEETA